MIARIQLIDGNLERVDVKNVEVGYDCFFVICEKSELIIPIANVRYVEKIERD